MADTSHSPLPLNVKDIQGQTFALLTVLGYAGLDKHGSALWTCMCSCPENTVFAAHGSRLRSGHTKSCGCHYKATRKTSAATHSGCYEPEYGCWAAMMKRCYNPKHISYPAYGGAGVAVQESWHDYLVFKSAMGLRPSPEHTIDRFPNRTGNYEIGNVRWATRKEQQRNMKSNRYLTFEGKTLTMAEWTEIKGWHRSKLKCRKYAGWTDERALGTP